MNLKDLLRKKILGSSLVNEYICLAEGTMSNPLKAYLKEGDMEYDITADNILLSYQPLILGLVALDTGLLKFLGRNQVIRLNLKSTETSGEIAWLELEKVSEFRMGTYTLFIYSGIGGKHKFLNSLHQWMNRGAEVFRPTVRDGILSANLYDQVRIAYAIPRNVSVISVGDGDRINMFPTDLHGAIGDNFYVGSLRKGGRACQQVEEFRKVVIAKVAVEASREIYTMGKNHMKELRDPGEFQLADARSEKFNLPLHRFSLSYKELLWKNSIDVGLHRIHFYEVINSKVLGGAGLPLCHIHRFYAQWRMDHGLVTEYFLR